MPGAGQLRERITFERRAEADDGYGNPIAGGWTAQLTVAARVLPLRGTEAVTAARLEGRQPVVITVRASGQARAIGADWRAVDARRGTIYAITAPPALTEDGAFLDILATTGEAA